MRIGLLTAGHDKPYVVPLALALAEAGVQLDFIGSDALVCERLTQTEGVRFLNLRGDQSMDVPIGVKARRIFVYYARLLRYVAVSDAQILHVIWNNKFETLDRTLLMLYYRLLGKRTILTAHNVNAAKRDGRDSVFNRITLRIQYLLCDHVFVHTEAMKRELCNDFAMPAGKVSVVPFGMNDTIPTTSITKAEARRSIGLVETDRVLLFFGMIVPYKGLEDLVDALACLAPRDLSIRLVIAGPIKRGSEAYWTAIRRAIVESGLDHRVRTRIGFVPDDEVERYFKAADAVVLPYRHVFQSGVPFLAFNFGLPVIATDVGSLREDVVEGRTGMLCAPQDPDDLARSIERYFGSDLYRQLPSRRDAIRSFARENHSWTTVAHRTINVYSSLVGAQTVRVEAERS